MHQGEIEILEKSILRVLLSDRESFVFPELGYLEYVSLPDKNTVFFRNKNMEKDSLSDSQRSALGNENLLLLEKIYELLSKDGQKLVLNKIGAFSTSKSGSGAIRISFILSPELKKELNGIQSSLLEKKDPESTANKENIDSDKKTDFFARSISVASKPIIVPFVSENKKIEEKKSKSADTEPKETKKEATEILQKTFPSERLRKPEEKKKQLSLWERLFVPPKKKEKRTLSKLKPEEPLKVLETSTLKKEEVLKKEESLKEVEAVKVEKKEVELTPKVEQNKPQKEPDFSELKEQSDFFSEKNRKDSKKELSLEPEKAVFAKQVHKNQEVTKTAIKNGFEKTVQSSDQKQEKLEYPKTFSPDKKDIISSDEKKSPVKRGRSIPATVRREKKIVPLRENKAKMLDSKESAIQNKIILKFILFGFAAFFVLMLVVLNVSETFYQQDKIEEDRSAVELHDNPTTLLDLAEKAYGNKAFWIYIYDANKAKLSTPLNIPSGVSLVIPDLSEYNVDVTDSLEIQRAIMAADAILNIK